MAMLDDLRTSGASAIPPVTGPLSSHRDFFPFRHGRRRRSIGAVATNITCGVSLRGIFDRAGLRRLLLSDPQPVKTELTVNPPTPTPQLESYLDEQIQTEAYDLQANKALLKLCVPTSPPARPPFVCVCVWRGWRGWGGWPAASATCGPSGARRARELHSHTPSGTLSTFQGRKSTCLWL